MVSYIRLLETMPLKYQEIFSIFPYPALEKLLSNSYKIEIKTHSDTFIQIKNISFSFASLNRASA